jgi:hypothetical protein
MDESLLMTSLLKWDLDTVITDGLCIGNLTEIFLFNGLLLRFMCKKHFWNVSLSRSLIFMSFV